jgi:hypothetical protein
MRFRKNKIMKIVHYQIALALMSTLIFGSNINKSHAVENENVTLTCGYKFTPQSFLWWMTNPIDCPEILNIVPESPNNLPSGWKTSAIGILPPIDKIVSIDITNTSEVVDAYYVSFKPISKKNNKYIWVNIPTKFDLEGEIYYRWNNQAWRQLYASKEKNCSDILKFQFWELAWATRDELESQDYSVATLNPLSERMCLKIPKSKNNVIEFKYASSSSNGIKCSYYGYSGWNCRTYNTQSKNKIFLKSQILNNGTKISK